MKKPKASIALTIDGRQVTVPEGTNIIDAARQVGIDVPHYCYHPSLSIAGSCRMCFVEIEGRPKMALGCDTRVAEGMVVRTDTPQVIDARRGMLEFFLINHPLDCPICDRGGECYLQWYAMDHGSAFTRTIEPRRRLIKPEFDPLIDLERNRCIYCSRCVRFLQEIGGERIIGTFQRGDRAHIGTFEWEPIRSIFSGMIIDYCPVGTLTNKPFRFKSRVWELDQVQSVCPYCSSGCGVTLWMKGGKLYRVTPPSTPQRVNFHIDFDSRAIICNQGRFACDFLGGENRLRQVLVRRGGRKVEASWDEALEEIAHRFTEIRRRHGANAIGFLVSSRATCEEMYLLQRLAREAAATNNIDWRTRCVDGQAAGAVSAALSRSTADIDDLENYDVILVINQNLFHTSPVVSLKLKEAARLKYSKVYVLDYHLDGWISQNANGVIHYPIENTERILEAIATQRPDPQRPDREGGPQFEDLLADIAKADNGLIVCELDACNGLFADRWARAILKLADSLGARWELLTVTGDRNATGAFVVGAQADRRPGGWVDDAPARDYFSRRAMIPPEQPGLSAPEMIEAARDGRLKALYILGADDFAGHPWLEPILAALDNLEMLVVQDTFDSPLSERADVVLPGSFFTEKSGTLLDASGWPGQFARGWQRPRGVQDDAVVLDVLAGKMGREFGYPNVDAVFEEMMRVVNPICPMRAGELCVQAPGDEMPIRCKNFPEASARVTEGKFRSVNPTYVPSCRLIPGTQPRSIPPAADGADPYGAPGEGLRMVWARSVFGEDQLGDRSGIMAPLRDPAWIKIHPDDAARLGLAEGDTVALEAEGVSADTALVRITRDIAPGLVFVPQNLAMLRFQAPPARLPVVALRKAPPKEDVGKGLLERSFALTDEREDRLIQL
jgi:NADH-quinone oxidoreductase chain G